MPNPSQRARAALSGERRPKSRRPSRKTEITASPGPDAFRLASVPGAYFLRLPFFFFLCFFFALCFVFLNFLTPLHPVTLIGVLFSITLPFWPVRIVGIFSGSATFTVTVLRTLITRVCLPRLTRFLTSTLRVTCLVGLQRSP